MVMDDSPLGARAYERSGGRRFTTWAGAVFGAFGVYLFTGDVTNFKKSFTDEPHVVRPALITIAFGIALVALAWLLAFARSNSSGTDGSAPPLPSPDPPPGRDPV